jgi:hypothetical protein
MYSTSILPLTSTWQTCRPADRSFSKEISKIQPSPTSFRQLLISIISVPFCHKQQLICQECAYDKHLVAALSLPFRASSYPIDYFDIASVQTEWRHLVRFPCDWTCLDLNLEWTGLELPEYRRLGTLSKGRNREPIVSPSNSNPNPNPNLIQHEALKKLLLFKEPLLGLTFHTFVR